MSETAKRAVVIFFAILGVLAVVLGGAFVVVTQLGDDEPTAGELASRSAASEASESSVSAEAEASRSAEIEQARLDRIAREQALRHL